MRYSKVLGRRVSAVVAVVALAGAPVVLAGTVILGDSGWQVTFDASLDDFVDISVDEVTPDAVFIQKSAEFTQPPGPGGFPTIAIQFQQIAWPAVSQIVINDEIVTNSTGVAWTDFHWELMDGFDAAFNPDLTFASGFATSPLDNQAFSPDNMDLWVDGFGLGPGGSDEVVPAGGVWFPGGGAENGELYIDVVPHEAGPFTVFTLKETPTPEPAAGLLLLVAAGLCRRRP